MPARIAVMGLAIPEPAILKEQGSRLCTGSKIQAKNGGTFSTVFSPVFYRKIILPSAGREKQPQRKST